MTEYTLKLKGNETSINSTSNSSFANASLVRLINTTGGTANIVQYLAGNTTNIVGNLTMFANTELLWQKAPTDTLGSNTTTGLLGTSVGFRD